MPSTSETLKKVWGDQNIWSQTASRLKFQVQIARGTASVFALLGAFLETLSGIMAGGNGLIAQYQMQIAIVGAVFLALGAAILKARASREHVRAWTRARSASEGLKEEVYRYLVGGPPYGFERTPQLLENRSQKVIDGVTDLSGHIAGVKARTRELPAASTTDDYIKARVNQQVNDYYRPRGEKYANIARVLENVEFLLGLVAVGIGAIAAKYSQIGPWVAVVTTAASAVAAHGAAERYDTLAMTYMATGNRLESLKAAYLDDPQRDDPTRVAKFVDDCENAISVENNAWMAEWSKEPQKKPQQ